MVENSSILQEARRSIGIETEPGVYEIEKGMIKRFIEALDDHNPLWCNEEYAKKSQYGGIIAPPALLLAIGQTQGWNMSPSIPAKAVFDATDQLEYYQPVRAGDTITVTCRISDIQEKQGKRAGKMLLVTLEKTYKNQQKELVAKCWRTTFRIIDTNHV